MTSQPALPWRSEYIEHPPSVRIVDDRGQVQAIVTPHLGSSGSAPDGGGPYGSGPLDRTMAGLDKITSSLHGVIGKVHTHIWNHRRGVLAEGVAATLALPDRSTGTVHNGSPTGNRRSNRTGGIDVYGRQYVVRHTSRRNTELRRGDALIATLRRTTWRTGNFRADGPPRYSLSPAANLDIADMLAIQVTASLLGPPGRTGGVSRTFSSMSPW